MKMAFVLSMTHVIQEPSGDLMRCFTTEETQGVQGHMTCAQKIRGLFSMFSEMEPKETLRSKEGKK